MSYCRMGTDSDVYAFPSIDGTFECCACLLTKKKLTTFGEISFKMHRSKTFSTREELLEHLEEHVNAGHLVPDYAFKILREEIG